MPRRIAPPEEVEAYQRRLERYQRQARVDAALEGCGVPPIHRHANLEDLGAVPEEHRASYQEAVARLRAALAQRPAIAALSGRRGPGKSYMASAIVLDHCRQGRSALFVNLGSYFMELKRCYDGRGDETAVEQRHLTPDLLVLDGAEMTRHTRWEDEKLTRLLVLRFEQMRATVITSNDDPKKLSRRLGESVMSRAMQCNGGIIPCPWPSLRPFNPVQQSA